MFRYVDIVNEHSWFQLNSLKYVIFRRRKSEV